MSEDKTQDKSGEGEDQTAKTVPLEDHTKVVSELQAIRAQAKKDSDALATLTKEMQSLKTKDSEGKGDFKGLYEQTKANLDDVTSKFSQYKEDIETTFRAQALENELVKQGLKQDSKNVMDFADLTKMPVERTNKGRIIVHGAETVAADLKGKYSFAFEKPKTSTVNSGGGNGAGGSGVEDSQLTAAYMTELEVKDKQKYKELYPRYLKAYQQRQKTGG